MKKFLKVFISKDAQESLFETTISQQLDNDLKLGLMTTNNYLQTVPIIVQKFIKVFESESTIVLM